MRGMVQKKKKEKKVGICVVKIHITGGYFSKCNRNSGMCRNNSHMGPTKIFLSL